MCKETKPTEPKTSILSSESTTTLVNDSGSYKSPARPRQKDYEAALGALQSRYGTGGNISSPKPLGEASDKLTLPLHLQVGSSKGIVKPTNTTGHRSEETQSVDSSKSPLEGAGTASRKYGNEPKKSVFGICLLKGSKKN